MDLFNKNTPVDDVTVTKPTLDGVIDGEVSAPMVALEELREQLEREKDNAIAVLNQAH